MNKSSLKLTVNGAHLKGNRTFLIAPLEEARGATTFPAELKLQNVGTKKIVIEWKLQALEGLIRVNDSNARSSEHTLSPGKSIVLAVEAQHQSVKRDDIRFSFEVNGEKVRKLLFTSLTNVRIWFSGRFEARLATENDPYNHPRGEIGWTRVLEGEKPFCSPNSQHSVPENAAQKGSLGRTIRFSGETRPNADKLGVCVTKVQGELGHTLVDFSEGDLIFGAIVELGEDCYFAGNHKVDNSDGLYPEEQHLPGHQPIANFELRIENKEGLMLEAASRVLRAKYENGVPWKRTIPTTRPFALIDDRPRPREVTGKHAYKNASKSFNPEEAGEFNEHITKRFKIKSLVDECRGRAQKLIDEMNILAGTGKKDSSDFRNLHSRVGFLFSRLLKSDIKTFQSENPQLKLVPAVPGTHVLAWNSWQEFVGLLSKGPKGKSVWSPHVTSSNNGFRSSVLKYMSVKKQLPDSFLPDDIGENIVHADHPGFQIHLFFFNYHSDDMCGQVAGCLFPRKLPHLLEYHPPT